MGFADIAVGINNALTAHRERDAKELDLKSLIAQRLFEQQMRTREFEQRQKYQDDNLASLKEHREQTAAHGLAGDLAIGDVLDPTQTTTLRVGNLGSHIEHESAELPSRSSVGFLRTAPSEQAGRVASGTGFLRTTAQPGHPAQDIYRGTAAQRKAQQQRAALEAFVQSLPTNSPERKALEYQLHTGDNPPAGMFQRDPTPSFQLQPIYDESGRASGAVRFNQRTGAVEPVDLPDGAGLRGRTGRAEAIPPRVQGFLMDLRSRHGTFTDAFQELQQVLANAPNETFDRLAPANALRQLYAQPTGSAGVDLPPDLAALLNPGGNGRGASPSGPSRASGPAAGPGGGNTITRDEIRAVASRLGISEQEAAQQARSRGMQVR